MKSKRKKQFTISIGFLTVFTICLCLTMSASAVFAEEVNNDTYVNLNVSADKTDLKDGEKQVQKSTDKFIKEIDAITDKKKKEIMEI